MNTPMRQVRMGQGGVVLDRRADGTLLVRAEQPLGSLPDKMTVRLDHWASTAPDRCFLMRRVPVTAADGTQGVAWQSLTYGETRSRVRRIAAALLSRNLSAERGIAILSGNDVEHALLGLAAQYAGIPYAPVSTAYSLISSDFGKLRHVLGLAMPGLVFASDPVAYGPALRKAVPAGVEIVTAGDPTAQDAEDDRAITRFADLEAEWVEGVSDIVVDAAHALVGPDTIAKLLFTSGSTGMPKGVINTQRMLCANQQMLLQNFPFLGDEPPVLVDWLPWNHTFGGNHNFNMALYNGGTFVIDNGKPVGAAINETVAALGEMAPTIYFNVPKGYEALVGHLRSDIALRTKFFSNLKVMFYAGAGLSPHIWDELESLAVASCGERVMFVTSLGATESAPAALICNRAVDQPGVVGIPCSGVEVKLVPSDAKLELRLRAPTITPGYWRQTELTQGAFDEEGFYKMGDAVRFVDEDRPELGFLFDGRISEDFKLATGTWVSVSTLRGAVLRHFAPLVSDVVISGHDRDDVAMILLPDLAACRDHLPDFGRGLDDGAVLSAASVQNAFQDRLNSFGKLGTGSSNRIRRAVILAERPSLDLGEVTDKGSLNQRAVLTHRASLVEALYASPPGNGVLVAS